MLAGILLTLVSIWYGQNHGLMPVEASDDAALVDGLFNSMMTVGTGIFLLVWGVIIISLIRFRRRAGDETDGPPIEGNIPLEIVWTAIPAVIVLVIGVYSFDVYNALGGFDPEAADQPDVVQVAMLPGEEMATPLIDSAIQKPMSAHHHHMALGVGADPETMGNAPDLTVKVMGLQYAWIFTYPESGVVSGELHIPNEKDVKLIIQAQDVLHAFWLPQFRLKQDAIPKQDAELRFTPKRIGEYPIVCAELCGPYHGAMASKLYVESQEDFDRWLQAQMPTPSSSEQPVATTLPENRSAAELLAVHAEQIGVDSTVLEQLHSQHDSQGSGVISLQSNLDRAEPITEYLPST